ncbi:MAG: hypothetical protein DID92_2727744646, partial [Candidatus Nitrotoga sp. SPKER]
MLKHSATWVTPLDELKALTVLNLEPNLTHKIFEQRIALLRLGKQDVVIYET